SMKKFPLFIVCTFVSLCGLSSFSYSETLEEIYKQALENDHLFRAAQASYDAGKEAKNLGRAGLLPSLNGSASWQSFEREDTLNEVPPEVSNSDSTTTGYSISLEQVLFDMSAWHNYKRGEASAEASAAQL